jgi:hypothetical protein
MLRSWLHLDAQDVNTVEKKNEGRIISLETVSVTSDINGVIRDSSIMKYDFLVKEENLPWIKEHGIRFFLLLPVKKPGPYYMRVAVKDQVSGKVGSAYQFVDIPDLKKDRLALSNLFVINNSADAAWIRSGVSKETAQSVPVPILRRDESRSPALRNYAPGDHFEYMSVIYNSKHRKEASPELESQFVLYKDGSELFKSDPEPLSLSGAVDFDRIPLMQRLLLGNSLQAGDYVLQLLVRDKRRGGKKGLASQTLTFGISADESTTEADH